MLANIEVPEVGDYVTYTRYFDDGIGTGMEQGAGYLMAVSGSKATIASGAREFTTPITCVVIRAKQYRLDV